MGWIEKENDSMADSDDSGIKFDMHEFVKEMSGHANLTWFRPWLTESISLRSNMIHPLNVAQIISLQNRDQNLMRETVTGISSGMLTTG